MSLDAINKESAVANHELFFIDPNSKKEEVVDCCMIVISVNVHVYARFILIFSITISWNQKH